MLPFYGTINDYLMHFRFPLNLDYLDDDEDKKEHNEAENEVEDDNVENEEEK